jgi:hypothetical protein
LRRSITLVGSGVDALALRRVESPPSITDQAMAVGKRPANPSL